MEKVKGICDHYASQIMTWYNGLEEVYQYGVVFLSIVVVFFIVAYFLLSRITK